MFIRHLIQRPLELEVHAFSMRTHDGDPDTGGSHLDLLIILQEKKDSIR